MILYKDFVRGQKITSLDTLMKQERVFVVFDSGMRLVHKGWFCGWHLQDTWWKLKMGKIFTAKWKGGDK